MDSNQMAKCEGQLTSVDDWCFSPCIYASKKLHIKAYYDKLARPITANMLMCYHSAAAL